MKPDELKTLRTDNEEDERRASDYWTNGAYAVIAANWVLVTTIKASDRRYVIGSLLLSVVFLLMRGFAHWLNIKHNRVIIEAEQNSPGTYEDAFLERTRWGYSSAILEKIELFVLIRATICFVAGASVSLRQANHGQQSCNTQFKQEVSHGEESTQR